MDILWIIETKNLITVLVGIAAAATVFTVGAPLLDQNNLDNRMKNVAIERNKIRAREREKLRNASKYSAREQKNVSLMEGILEKFSAEKIFDVDQIKQTLIMAGLRSKKHITTYMFLSLALPIILTIGSFLIFEIFNIGENFEGRLLFSLVIGLISFFLPKFFIHNMIKSRQQSIRNAWSDTLDLVLICVESGMSLEMSLKRVAEEIGIQSIPLAEELNLTVAELSYLQDRRQALDNLAIRTGMDNIKSVTTSLIQAEKYGTPLGTALRVLSQENRDQRMSEAEKKAGSLPPKLTVPLIVFFLPVLFIIIMGPAIIGAPDM